MSNVEFLKIVAERIKFTRKKYDNENVPTDLDDIIVVPFFGDIKHTYILSTFILNNFKRTKTSKYLILISYPGFEHIFPYVDEYWQPSDLSQTKQIFLESDYFENKSEFSLKLLRSLNENFRSVINPTILKELYENKFKEKYWDMFGKEESQFQLPMIPSSAIINKETLKEINSRNNKIFLVPSTHINSWSNGKYNKLQVPKNFYIELINNLNENKIFPIVWNNFFSYDLQSELKDKIDCIFINHENLFEVLSAIRVTGCVLDIFNGISKFSNIARTPSIILDERSKYFLSREYEIDDLIELKLPGKRIYNSSYSVVNGNKNYWQNDLFRSINKSCSDLVPYIDRELLPSTTEVVKKMNLSIIRKIKNRKMGTKFIKIEKLI